MIYEYQCYGCGQNYDIHKSYKELDEREFCPQCGSRLTRKFIFKVQVSTPNLEPHFNEGFGKVIHNKRQLKDTIKKHNDDHGTDLVELGNDKAFKSKRKSKDYDYHEMYRRMKKMRGK